MSTRTSDVHKDPATLEHEVDQIRARLGETVEELGDRLSPGELLDQALTVLRRHGGEFGRNLGRQAKNNPVPLILTGIGLTWLMSASGSSRYAYTRAGSYDPYGHRDLSYGDFEAYDDSVGYVGTGMSPTAGVGATAPTHGDLRQDEHDESLVERGKSRVAEAGDRLRSAAHEAKVQVRSTAGAARQGMHDQTEHVREQAAHLKHAARRQAEHLQSSFEDLLNEQPLLAGALGVALGAALGALIPSTETEDELMGRARDQAVDRSKELASKEYRKARETVRETGRKIREKVSEAADDVRGKEHKGSRASRKRTDAGRGNEDLPAGFVQTGTASDVRDKTFPDTGKSV